MPNGRSATATLISAGRICIARHVKTDEGLDESALTEAIDRLEEFHKAACLLREAQGLLPGHPQRAPLLSKALAALAELA